MDAIARAEVKYTLPLSRMAAVRADLAAVLQPDPHNGSAVGGGYWVRSLYFETHGLRSWREKQAGLDPRFKLRVRGYPPWTRADPLVLEIKHRRAGRVHKERAQITATDLDALLAQRNLDVLNAYPEDPVVRRFVALRLRLGYARPLMVDYRRIAFVHPSPHVYVRANLDVELSTATHGRFATNQPLGLVLGKQTAILEVKTEGFSPPGWLPALAERHHLRPQSVSKYAIACSETYALGNQV